jgi:hypothetical protein
MQTNLESKPQEKRDAMKSHIPMRARMARFLSDRYAQRERPNYIPELLILGTIVVASIWPILSLVAAMELVR